MVEAGLTGVAPPRLITGVQGLLPPRQGTRQRRQRRLDQLWRFWRQLGEFTDGRPWTEPALRMVSWLFTIEGVVAV